MAYTQTYQAYEPAIWDPKLLWYFKRGLTANKVCTEYSSDLAQGGNIIYVPSITDGFSATQIVTTTGDITPTNLADTKTSITMNQWWGDAFRVTKAQAEKVGTSYNIIDGYMQTMAYNLSQKVDKTLLGNITSATFTVGNSATAIPSTTLEEALRIANSQNMPFNELAWIFSSKAYWGQLANVVKYYTQSIYGEATIPSGFVNRLYGIKVMVSDNLTAGVAGTGRYGALIHPSAIGFAIKGGGPQLSVKEAEALRRTYIADVFFGHTLLKAGRIIKILQKGV